MASRGTGAGAAPIRVYQEAGRRSTFAVALDWPGWCRRGKTAESALSELEAYRSRYAAAVRGVPDEGPIEVIGTIDGTGTTDFGAPDAVGPWDDDPPTGDELVRQVHVLGEAWASFDRVVAGAPVELRKGPRGGGRDRDAIVSHVMEAERVYGRKVGIRVAPRTPWDEQRAAITAALLGGADGGSWPVGYALRRFAWHVLDHVWEIEDKSD